MTLLGTSIVRWATRAFGQDVATRVFEPLLADWQRELLMTPSVRGRVRAWLAGAVAVLRCTIAVGIRAAAPRVEDWPRLGHGVAVAAGFLVLGIGLLLAPFVPWWINRGGVFGRLVLDLVPATVGFALPFALLPAAMTIGSKAQGPASWRARVAVTVGALAATGVLAGMHGWVAPVAGRDFQQRLRGTLPTTPTAVNAPAVRLSALAASAGSSRASVVERRRRATTMVVWPAALLFLGWRLGRHRGRAGTAALAGWWLLAVAIAFAFQPAQTPFASLHPMNWVQTPEFATASVWFTMALASRPRHASQL